ncbi:MAG: methyltransferase domain-containing protein [Deltaproteobacteria bacterium]|nr:methyltransferase domain-containing protein [Deltaproteobacteria bacterium]
MTRGTDASAIVDRAPASAGAGACRLCGGATGFVLRARDRTARAVANDLAAAIRGPLFEYAACSVCGALQLESIPADLARHYGADYYTARQRIASGPPGGWLGARRLRSHLRLALRPGPLAHALSGRRYGRFDWFRRTETRLDDPILDVGCGAGRLLFRLHADGFRRLVGIDPHLSPETARHAAGRPGLRLEAVPPERHAGTYHLVMAHHSFEHMAEPRRAFAAMAARVAPGGWLLLRVPLADSWAAAHYGADWAQLDAPRHLQIPTRRSIALLAAGAGLRVEHVEDDSGPFQIAGSEAAGSASGEALGAGARAARWLAVRRRAARLRRAGQGDQAAFYLRRMP